MSTFCATCGAEVAFASGLAFTYCAGCKPAPSAIQRFMKDPEAFLSSILLRDSMGDEAEIIGVESDVGATRVYVASERSIATGVALMHYIRSEELELTDALRARIGWKV
jgi:hypothetical protein